jgi:hypothetical protein
LGSQNPLHLVFLVLEKSLAICNKVMSNAESESECTLESDCNTKLAYSDAEYRDVYSVQVFTKKF